MPTTPSEIDVIPPTLPGTSSPVPVTVQIRTAGGSNMTTYTALNGSTAYANPVRITSTTSFWYEEQIGTATRITATTDTGQVVLDRTFGTGPLFNPVQAECAQPSDGDLSSRFALPNMPMSNGFETWNSYNGTVTANNGPLVNQRMVLGYFVADAARTLTRMTFTIGNTNGATITLARQGIYQIDPVTGDGTLVASTPNTVGIATAGTFATTTTNLSTPLTTAVGVTYAMAILVVGTTMPTVLYLDRVGADNRVPRTMGHLASQADLPTTFLNSALTFPNSHVPYMRALTA